MKTWISLMFMLMGPKAFASVPPGGGVMNVKLTPPPGKAVAAFAEGCFWCSVHVFEAVKGVDSAIAGYAGGTTVLPTYEQVNTGKTGHAESTLVYYDPKIISYDELINVFFSSQDPTTPDQQGPDRGNEYRSIIFYSSSNEKKLAEAAKIRWGNSGKFNRPIVSQIVPLKSFTRAEQYHQHYIESHPDVPYVKNVSIPRYNDFVKSYKGKLKSNK